MTAMNARGVPVDLPPRCGYPIMLNDGEESFFDSLPDAVFVVDTVLYGQVEFDHIGPHLANGQDSGADEWWLRWEDDDHRETVCLPPCPAIERGTDPSNGGGCLPPDGHAGRHSFELRHMV